MAYLATFEDGSIVQSIPAYALPQSTVFTYNNVKLCFGSPGKTALDKYDLDGNHWEITVSNSLLAVFKITSPDGVVIYTNTIQASGITNPKYYDDNKYYFVYMLIENSSGDISYLAVTLYGGGTTATMDARGVNGVTQVTNNGTYVPFPQNGFWDAGFQVQRAFTYAIANPSAYTTYGIYNIDDNTGVNTFYLKNSVFSFNESRKLPRATIIQYFPKTFSINSGDLSECTITLNKTTFFYTGSAIKPEVTVTTPTGIKLDELVDYTLSYFDNVNMGTGQVLITGNNLWTGTARKYFLIVSDSDPFSPGGISTIGGGDGSFDDSSDEVPIPELPNLSSLSSGFINLWCPTSSQLSSLVSWLWSTSWDLETLKKVFTSPIDMILGLSIVPVTLPYSTATIKFGNMDTGITMNKVGSQYAIVDCGSIEVEPYWGGYLDYSPYTKIDIFLPYIGFQHLDPDIIMNSVVDVKYHIDALSGACIAYVCSQGNVVYSFMGNCAVQLPVSEYDMTRLFSTLIGSVGTIAGFAAAGTGIASSGGYGISSDNILGKIGGAITGALGGAAATAITNVSSKPTINKSGSITSAGGLLAVQRPYLVITRPRQALPENQNWYTGYPAFITVQLEKLTGFTVVEHIHLENVPATDSEIQEILEILHNGFII